MIRTYQPTQLRRSKWRNPLLNSAFVCFCVLLLGILPASAREFTQEAFQYRSDGTVLPAVEINPAKMTGLTRYEYDLGRERHLSIRTDLDPGHHGELEQIAETVRYCYRFLETRAGRPVTGNVLLYLLEYSERPRCYRFHTEVADDSGWNQIRVALVSSREVDSGLLEASHVSEFLFDTLPHELTHGLLEIEPTVRHDRDGEPPVGTRWFIEGLCEKWAKDFCRSEAPREWRRGLARRHLDRPPAHPGSEDTIWSWGRTATPDWPLESDRYGLAMLLVQAWSESISPRTLLARMTAAGGNLDGAALIDLLRETTGRSREDLLRRALVLRSRLTIPAQAQAHVAHSRVAG